MRSIIFLVLMAACSVAKAVVGSDADFSIAVIGDMHFGTTAHIVLTNRFVPWILTNRTPGTANVKVLISPGDVFEQHTNDGTYITAAAFALRDGLWQLASNGVLVDPSQGNHDANGPGGWAGIADQAHNGINPELTPWQDVYGTNIWNQVGSIGTRLTNDYSNWAVTFTNVDGTKFLFLTYQVMDSCSDQFNDVPAQNACLLDQFYDQNSWITNMALTHLDHNVILIAHYILNANGDISGKDATGYEHWNGPSVAILDPRLLALPNFFMTISGHDRRMFKTHKYIYGSDQHIVDILGVNSQGHTNNPGFIFLLTFRSATKTVEHSTYDTVSQRWIENRDPDLHFFSEGQINTHGEYYTFTNRWTNSLTVRPAYQRTTTGAIAPSRGRR